MSRMNPKERKLVISLSVIAVLVLYFLFVLDPILKEQGRVDEGITQAERKLQQLQVAQGFGDNEEAWLERLRAEIGYEASGSSDVHVLRVIRAIEDACYQTGAQLGSAVPLDIDEEDSFSKFPVEVQVKGTYEAVFRMLHRLRSSRPKLSIERMTMDYDDRSDTFSVQMVVASYTPPPPQVEREA